MIDLTYLNSTLVVKEKNKSHGRKMKKKIDNYSVIHLLVYIIEQF